MCWFARALLALLVLGTCFAGQSALAHPEDEFCTPGQGAMDPALCRALAALDSSELTTDALIVELDRTLSENLVYFIEQGVRHIIPGGYDHILFVLALFLSVQRLRPLLFQISLFTLAHSATLALAANGWVNIPAHIVEPLIAASIALVALETVFLKNGSKWRPLIVFGFGLLHGLGFAGFFLEQNLPDGFFWSSLIGFNIGVEIGQIGVVIVAWLLMFFFMDRSWYRKAVTIPGSLIIAGFGLLWTIERVI